MKFVPGRGQASHRPRNLFRIKNLFLSHARQKSKMHVSIKISINLCCFPFAFQVPILNLDLNYHFPSANDFQSQASQFFFPRIPEIQNIYHKN